MDATKKHWIWVLSPIDRWENQWMFLDVFWVLYPQNEEDSSQVLQNLLQGLQIILQFLHLPVTYQIGNHNTKNHEIRMERLMLDLHRSLPAQSFVPHSDRSGGALCRTYEATQPRLRRQWAGFPATCPSGTAGQETVGLFGWMWLYSPVNDSKAVSQTTHMDWILIPPIKIWIFFLANIVNFPIAVKCIIPHGSSHSSY